MNIIYIGDVVGKPGRECIRTLVPALKDELKADFVIINGENAAGGFGITPDITKELLQYGDLITTGNHVWQKKEIMPFLDTNEPIIRPANYPGHAPGRGRYSLRGPAGSLGVILVEGRIFMKNLDCPFRAIERELEALGPHDAIIIEVHAEATSEKVAIGWYFDGKVSAVVGSHTHVQTADARILPQGTAYLSDLGMTGPMDSVIGMKVETSIKRMLTQMPTPHDVATDNSWLNGAFIQVENGRAVAIKNIQRSLGK